MVLPDNVLFEAGAGETIRRRLLSECDVHTILRLPLASSTPRVSRQTSSSSTGNQLPKTPGRREVWIYDLRTNKHFTLKTNPLTSADLADFIGCYRPEDRARRVETERFHRFTYDEVIARDKANLDIIWLRDETLDDGSDLPAPAVLAAEIVDDLEAALAQFAELAAMLPSNGEGNDAG